MAILTWNSLEDLEVGVTTWPQIVNANLALLDEKVIRRGLFSARPAAGTAGRLYLATDQPAVYYDNGTSWQWVTGERYSTVNTSDGTWTTIATVPIAANKTYTLRAKIIARRTGGAAGTADDGAVYVRRAAYTTKVGTITLLGSLLSEFTAEDQAGWDVRFQVSGTDVLIQVLGAVNNNVTWEAWVDVS